MALDPKELAQKSQQELLDIVLAFSRDLEKARTYGVGHVTGGLSKQRSIARSFLAKPRLTTFEGELIVG